jgi:maltooligosyltrehalose synthase
MELLKSITEYFSKHFGSQPSVDLDELDFLVRPHIIKRGKKYLLRYQMATTEPPQLIRPIQAKTYGDRAYYFFGLAVSKYDLGELVEHDITLDDFTEFVESNRVYWLNKDGTELQLEVRII